MADQQVRAVIQDILHFHPSEIAHKLYARKGDGGMGYPDWHSVTTMPVSNGVSFLSEW
jgi:hypothetical protein